MDALQRSEMNNQTNNGSNEKWTPGSQGATRDEGQPLDHTHPHGHGVQQLGNQQQGTPENSGTQQTGAGAGMADGTFQRSDMAGSTIPGGSMQTQINGGSGPEQGITDSHQRQMEQKSGAYGLLEQPVGARPKDSGVNVTEGHDMGRDEVRGTLGSQNAQQPDLQGGSIGPRGGNLQSTQGGGMHGPESRVAPSALSGSMGNRQAAPGSATYGSGMAGPQGSGVQGTTHDAALASGQEAQRGNTQQGVAGSRAMSNQHGNEGSAGGVHESNDVAGGLPRSPGNGGADHASSIDRTGSQTGPGGAESGPAVHDSNDAAGGYPRSPGGANRLSGSDNMDDDTGFKRKP
jgi:hypothetical protein